MKESNISKKNMPNLSTSDAGGLISIRIYILS